MIMLTLWNVNNVRAYFLVYDTLILVPTTKDNLGEPNLSFLSKQPGYWVKKHPAVNQPFVLCPLFESPK